MRDLNSTASQFLEELAEFEQLWRSIDVRALAVRVSDRWYNLRTSCELDPRQPADVPRIDGLVRTPHMLALQAVLPADQLKSVIEQLGSGEITLRGEAISYRQGESWNSPQISNEGKPYNWGDLMYIDRASSFLQSEYAWSALTFSASGDSVRNYLNQLPGDGRRLDQEIRTHSHPYDGLAGVARQLIRGPDRFDRDHRALFEVIAPIKVRFAREWSRFGEELQIGLTMGSASPLGMCRIGCVAIDVDGLPRTTTWNLADLYEVEDSPSGTRLFLQTGLTAGSVTLFLNVGSYCVDKITLTRLPAHGPNPRVEAFRTIDPDLDSFLGSFNPGIKPDQFAFERAIGRLFTFLGFTVDVLGPEKKLSEGVDCFVYTPTTVLAVECTTGSIDANGKLGKLISRTRAVAAALDTEVLPVMVSALPRERIAGQDLLGAGEDGIAVLAREELNQLFEMAVANAPLASAVEFIAGQIPPIRSEESPAQILRRLRIT